MSTEENLQRGMTDKSTAEAIELDGNPKAPLPSSNTSSRKQTQDKYYATGWRLQASLFCIFFGMFFAMLDASIVATILVTISKHFHNFSEVNWVVLAYFLTYTGFCMVFARVSDIYGRKWTLVAVHVIFGLSSIACSVAQTMFQLVLFRGFQGIGGAGLFAVGLAAMVDLVPLRKIPLMSAIVGVLSAVAGVLGPILGGAIGDRTTWRWVFWLNIPGSVIILTLLLIGWPSHVRPKKVDAKTALKSIDFVGAILLMGATIVLCFALQQAARFSYAWDSAAIIVSLVISGLCWIAFFGWSILLGKRKKFGIFPIFPTYLVGKRVFGASTFLMGLAGMAFYVCVVTIPERAQIVNNKSVLTSGVYLLPFLGSMALSMIFWGGLNGKKNRIGPCLIGAASLQLLGQGLLSTLPGTEAVPKQLFGYEVLIAFGIGGYFGIIPIVAAVECENVDRGIAQGIISQSRFLGGSIGLAVAAIILNTKVKDSLTGMLPPSDLHLLYNAPTALKEFPPEQQELIRHVYSDGFNDIMRVMTYITAVMFPVSLLTLSRHPTPIQKRIDDGEDDDAVVAPEVGSSETQIEQGL